MAQSGKDLWKFERFGKHLCKPQKTTRVMTTVVARVDIGCFDLNVMMKSKNVLLWTNNKKNSCCDVAIVVYYIIFLQI